MHSYFLTLLGRFLGLSIHLQVRNTIHNTLKNSPKMKRVELIKIFVCIGTGVSAC